MPKEAANAIEAESAIEGDVDRAISTCGGDPRAAVRALIIMVDHLTEETRSRAAGYVPRICEEAPCPETMTCLRRWARRWIAVGNGCASAACIAGAVPGSCSQAVIGKRRLDRSPGALAAGIVRICNR